MLKEAKFLQVGLGGVGFHIARRLTHEGHSLTVIERDPDLIRAADGEFDARLIQGDALSFRTWRDVDAAEMDYLIAVTNHDAVNIMACLIADRCGVPTKIARIRTVELWDRQALLTPADLKIDLIIRPEELTAQEIARLLKIRAGNVIIDIADGSMQVVAARLRDQSPLVHCKLKDVSKAFGDYTFRIVSVARGIDTFIPSGEFEFLPHDHVFVLAHTQDLPKLMEISGLAHERRHRVMIIGGGMIGSRVAQLLEATNPVRLVEIDERTAEQLSYTLGKTTILHGDGSRAQVLIQAGLLDMDTIITATGDNETNIMTSVLAKHLIRNQPGPLHGTEGKTITLVKREAYLTLASAMGSDIVLNKKVLAGNEILKYIRRGKLLSVAHLHGADAEVVVLVAEKGAPITEGPLFKLEGMKGKIIIGGVCREGDWEIAVGATHVQPGEKVLGICASHHLPDLQRLILS